MANPIDLCTIDDLTAWISPAPPSTDQALLERLITAASDFIQRYLQRYIPQASYKEIRNGTGGKILSLANFPIVSVDSVLIDNLPIPFSPNPTVAGFTFDETQLYLRAGFFGSSGVNFFTKGHQNVEIVYEAGYSAIPPELSQACIELIVYRYRERGREGVVQENVVGISNTTFKMLDITPSIASGLKPFRSVAPIRAVMQPFVTPPSPPL